MVRVPAYWSKRHGFESRSYLSESKNINRQALCLGGHTKVRAPGATIARKNISCVINK